MKAVETDIIIRVVLAIRPVGDVPTIIGEGSLGTICCNFHGEIVPRGSSVGSRQGDKYRSKKEYLQLKEFAIRRREIIALQYRQKMALRKSRVCIPR